MAVPGVDACDRCGEIVGHDALIGGECRLCHVLEGRPLPTWRPRPLSPQQLRINALAEEMRLARRGGGGQVPPDLQARYLEPVRGPVVATEAA